MARLRSREAETEDVNPRRLQRGAVKRTHLTRWAVGRDEIAPGVVGDIHLNPSVIEVIREQASSVSGHGMTIALTASTDQTIPVGGALLEVDAADTDFRSSVFDPALPTSEIVMPLPAVVSVHVSFRWADWRHGGRVRLLRGGVVVAQSFAGWGTRFEGVLHAGSVHEGETLSVEVDHLDEDASHDVTDVRVTPKVEGAPVGVAVPVAEPAEAGLYVVGHVATSLTLTKVTETTSTLLDSVTVSGIGTFRNLRARADAGQIRARVWADGASEPSTWDIDVIDPDPLPDGYAGVTGATGFGTGDWRYDTFEVDNDGTPTSTNFSGYATGAGIPTGWDPIYGVSTGWSIVADAAYAGGKYLSRLGNGASYIAWTTAGVGDTQDVTVRGYSNRTLGVVLRGQDIR